MFREKAMFREYVGLFDDVIARYRPHPYGSTAMVRQILAECLLFGAPGLLNDGYLVQHPVFLEFLLSRDDGFLELLERDRLTVASVIQPPSVSIERRAAVGVETHRELIESDDWTAIARAIDDLPGQSERSWPSRDLTDGFVHLTRKLRALVENNSLPEAQGLPSNGSIGSFLDRFLEALSRHHEAPRTQWEGLAKEIWAEDKAAVVAMLDLANLIYHLNITMLLGADEESTGRIVTRDSPILAPLLGLHRADDNVQIPDVQYVEDPILTPSLIAAFLEETSLVDLRGQIQRGPLETSLLSEYIVALAEHDQLKNLLVPPISIGLISGTGSVRTLKVVHASLSKTMGHIRFAIPPELCNSHASHARPFGGDQ